MTVRAAISGIASLMSVAVSGSSDRFSAHHASRTSFSCSRLAARASFSGSGSSDLAFLGLRHSPHGRRQAASRSKAGEVLVASVFFTVASMTAYTGIVLVLHASINGVAVLLAHGTGIRLGMAVSRDSTAVAAATRISLFIGQFPFCFDYGGCFSCRLCSSLEDTFIIHTLRCLSRGFSNFFLFFNFFRRLLAHPSVCFPLTLTIILNF